MAVAARDMRGMVKGRIFMSSCMHHALHISRRLRRGNLQAPQPLPGKLDCIANVKLEAPATATLQQPQVPGRGLARPREGELES